NLQHAEVVLIVEGETDRIALSKLLPESDAELNKAMKDGTIAIDSLAGGSNLAYKLSSLRNAICVTHCFLDNDECTNMSIEKAEAEGLLSAVDYTIITCKGMRESEIEDLYNIDIYEDLVKRKFGITITPDINGHRHKWSKRMEKIFQSQGKRWNDKVKKQVKTLISELVESSQDNVINTHRKDCFDALIRALRDKLGV
ncbi:MAG: hypothetical protein WC962_10340, partial [Phycisphaerae bacterium]